MNKQYESILLNDQLRVEVKYNTSFTQLTEPEINFPPTYRRQKHTNEEYSNKKNQSPSYTDRIMYYCKPHSDLITESYMGLEEQFGRYSDLTQRPQASGRNIQH